MTIKQYYLDGDFMITKELLFTHLDRHFEFPKHFGKNLDALFDVLSSIDEPTVIEFSHYDHMLEHLGNYGQQVIKVFQEVEKTNENVTVNFYLSPKPGIDEERK